jgi:hypothetical protein
MADEVRAGFVVPGVSGAFLAAWKAAPPEFLGDAGYRLIDESYESLVYEADVTTKTQRIVTWGFGDTIYRLVFTFRDGGDTTTAVTVVGQAKAPVRAALAEYVHAATRTS